MDYQLITSIAICVQAIALLAQVILIGQQKAIMAKQEERNNQNLEIFYNPNGTFIQVFHHELCVQIEFLIVNHSKKTNVIKAVYAPIDTGTYDLRRKESVDKLYLVEAEGMIKESISLPLINNYRGNEHKYEGLLRAITKELKVNFIDVYDGIWPLTIYDIRYVR